MDHGKPRRDRGRRATSETLRPRQFSFQLEKRLSAGPDAPSARPPQRIIVRGPMARRRWRTDRDGPAALRPASRLHFQKQNAGFAEDPPPATPKNPLVP